MDSRSIRWVGVGVALVAMTVFAQGTAPMPDITNGSVQDRVDALAMIQPGLGTVMIEYGNRMTNTYYAAKAGNWGLAQYMLKEALEIQEVGEITRPARAGSLKTVEAAFLDPLNEAILAKDWAGFQTKFDAAVTNGCNGCHTSSGFAYIKYQLPPAPAETYLDFNVASDPTPP